MSNNLDMRNNSKILQTLNYLAFLQGGEKKISQMKAYKLIWLADRYHLRQYGRTITYDQYYALPHGIVPSNAKKIIDGKIYVSECRNYLNTKIRYCFKSIKDPIINLFSETDIEVLKLIHSKYGSFSPQKLSDLSHKFPEWLKFKDKLTSTNSKHSYPIALVDFFLNYDDGQGLFNDDDDFLSISKEIATELI